MKRYYFLIRVVVPKFDEPVLMGRCVSVIHGFISQRSLSNIGIAFPEWSEKSVGRSIACVSESKELLSELIQQNYFKLMESEGFFELSEIFDVPEGLPEVQFVRNQSIAKCFAGDKRRRLERAKRRALERGEEFKPSLDDQNRQVEQFHKLFMHSKMNSEHFILHIQKREADKVAAREYGSYGFATNQKYMGTVPELADLR